MERGADREMLLLLYCCTAAVQGCAGKSTPRHMQTRTITCNFEKKNGLFGDGVSVGLEQPTDHTQFSMSEQGLHRP